MIALRNKLYESLLDDEDELISKSDDVMINDLANQIFKKYKYYIENDGKVSFFGQLSSNAIITRDIIKNIFSGNFLTRFKRFSSIILHKINISDFFKNPISIDKIDYLYISTDSVMNLKQGDIDIKEINEFEVCVELNNQIDWLNLFKNTKIKSMVLKPSSEKLRFNMEKIPPISGLTMDKLIIDYSMVPGYECGFFNKIDWNKVNEYIEYIKNNNNIKYIYIIDGTESTRIKFYNRYIKVKKIKLK